MADMKVAIGLRWKPGHHTGTFSRCQIFVNNCPNEIGRGSSVCAHNGILSYYNPQFNFSITIQAVKHSAGVIPAAVVFLEWARSPNTLERNDTPSPAASVVAQ